MPKIRTDAERLAEERARLVKVARALLEAEPAQMSKVVVHVFPDDRPPRYPAVGLHPGAIDGSVPHRCRLVSGR